MEATLGKGGHVASQSSPGPRFRLRFAGLVALVALVPLLVAAWAVSRLVENNEVDRADSDLTSVVRVVRADVNDAAARTQRRASRVASWPKVRVAVGSRDIPYLRRFVTLHPNVSFTVGDTVIGGRNPGPAIRRSAEFTRGERTVATVAVMKPLDERFVGALAGAAGTPRGDLLVIDHGRVVVGVSKGAMLTPVPTRPADVRLGTSDYRALATVGDPGRPSPSIVALEPRDSIDDAVSHAWWRALWAALATLATVGVLAYVAAPLVAGRRWTRRLLPWELEEQFAVEGDGSEPFSAPVPSHGSAPSGGIATTPVPAAAQAANYHVVVIDDDPVERTLIADALRPERIDVAATGDADQALRLLGAGDADLAILDWKMSGRSGAEILAELNIRHPELPVLVVADDLETQQRHVASLLGAGDFLIRPLDESAVVAKVQEVFEREDGRTP